MRGDAQISRSLLGQQDRRPLTQEAAQAEEPLEEGRSAVVVVEGQWFGEGEEMRKGLLPGG